MSSDDKPSSSIPTPRTDAAAMEASGNCDDDAEGQAVVGIRFARQLERELAEANNKLGLHIVEETNAKYQLSILRAETARPSLAAQEVIDKALALPSRDDLHSLVKLPGDNQTHIANLETAYTNARMCISGLIHALQAAPLSPLAAQYDDAASVRIWRPDLSKAEQDKLIAERRSHTGTLAGRSVRAGADDLAGDLNAFAHWVEPTNPKIAARLREAATALSATLTTEKKDG